MTCYGSYAEIRSDLVDIVKAPVRMRVSDAAEQYVRISEPGGYQGPYDSKLTPYMIEPMNTLSSLEHESVVFVGPARSSKTLSLVDCWYAYAVMCDPGDMGLYFPIEKNAKDFSNRRISRLNRASREIGSMLSPRSRDDNIFSKTFKNGMMLDLLHPSSSNMAQRDFRYVGLSDYDSFPDDIGGEGSGYDLALKRIQNMMSAGMCMVESSPKKEIKNPKWRPSTPHEAPPADGIFSLFNRGDRRWRYWPCIDCGEHFVPWFKLLWFPEIDNVQEAAEQAVMVCPNCGTQIEHKHKSAMDSAGVWLKDGQSISANGKITGEAIRSRIASFWLPGPAAKFQSWAGQVAKYLQAKREYERTGSERALKTTVNVDQGAAYLSLSRKSTRTADELMARAETWEQGVVPDGVRFLLCLVDVQKNGFEIATIGYGVEQEAWLVDRFALHWSDRVTSSGEREPLDPAAHQEDWSVLNDLIGKAYPLGDGSGRLMAVHAIGVDTGGIKGVTPKAYNWWRSLKRSGKHRKAHPLKGEGKKAGLKSPRVRVTWPDSSSRKDRHSGAKGDVPVLALNVHELKDALSNDFSRAEDGAGYIHLPEWLPDKYFSEIVAETRLADRWDNEGRERNETWDHFTYGKALYIHLGAESINWDRPPKWAAIWDRNLNVSGGEKKPLRVQKPQPPPTGFGSDDWSSRL
jgi:phage terminase large subunit GpA-like protein